MLNITQEEIIKDWGEYNTPVISIKCMAYNHGKYIEQALDGFLMQKTQYPFEVIIHDDASTDNTTEIIREYEGKFPKIIKPIYETENQYSKGSGVLSSVINPFLIGKYIALCEGDDYWIDEYKLQKQIQFLEENPDYGLVYTKAKQFNQDKNKFFLKPWGEDFKNAEYFLKTNNKIPTLTVCYRTELVSKYIEEIQPQIRKWRMGDYPMWLWFAFNSKIKFMDSVTGVYRVLSSSASHNKDIGKAFRFILSTYDIKRFYAEKYNVNLPPFDIPRREINLYIGRGFRKEAAEKIEALDKKTKADKMKLIICKNAFLFFCFSIALRIRKVFKNRQ